MVLSQYKFRSIAAHKVHPKSIPRGGMDAAAKLGDRHILRSILLKFSERFLSLCTLYGASLNSEASPARVQLPMIQNLRF